MNLRRWFLRFYGVHIATFMLALMVVGSVYSEFLDRTSSHLLEDLFSVTLRHLESELHDLPKDSWPGAIRRYQIQMGIPVHVRPMDSFTLAPENQRALARGDIIMIADTLQFVEHIEHTDLVLTIGPIDYMSFLRRERWMELLALMAIAVVLGIPAWIQLRPLQRDLRGLDSAAQSLARGELTVRAPYVRRSPLRSLAITFNTMAANIEALDKHKKSMVSAISHELRLPMTRLRYRLEMLRADQPQTEATVHECVGELDALTRLVDELLLYSRLQQPEIRLRRQMVDSSKWLRQVLDRFNRSNNIALDLLRSPTAAATMNIDPSYLERAISNLIGNALRYARSTVQVTLDRQAGDLVIHVDDDGPGIPEVARERVFEPFTRLTEDGHGYGLGLAIVQQVMRWHGGQAQATVSPMGGARLTLRWPEVSI